MRILPLTFLFLTISLVLSAQLTFVVDEIPSSTPDGEPIYVAGNFQAWDPGNPDWQLEDNGDGTWSITFSPAPGMLNFKFTRGSWATVEGNEFGGYLPDRSYDYAGGEETVYFQILSWEGAGGNNSTAAENVTIIDTDFYIPQLDRNRRIWIYLPPDYETTDNYYKVLYMHDGQNVFDLSTSFAGEWEVDETLNTLFDEGDEGCIIVGIDNGGVHRIDEYSPWVNEDYGGGEGDLYMQFLVETLKPYIDEEYRTLTDREHTGLMGSSLGGLITFYGGLEYSDTFSRMGVFSPSYWFAWDEETQFLEDVDIAGPMKIYTIAGELEGGSMVDNAEAMDALYGVKGLSDDEYLTVTHSDGQHSEWYWAREFEDAYLWLWNSSVGMNDQLRSDPSITIFPNPARDEVRISGIELQDVSSIQIMDLKGRTLSVSEPSTRLNIADWEGSLMIRILFEDGRSRLFTVLR